MRRVSAHDAVMTLQEQARVKLEACAEAITSENEERADGWGGLRFGEAAAYRLSEAKELLRADVLDQETA